MKKYERIAKYFKWSPRKPSVPFDELLPTERQILVEIANSIALREYPPTHVELAALFGLPLTDIDQLMRDLENMGYLSFTGGSSHQYYSLQLVIQHDARGGK